MKRQETEEEQRQRYAKKMPWKKSGEIPIPDWEKKERNIYRNMCMGYVISLASFFIPFYFISNIFIGPSENRRPLNSLQLENVKDDDIIDMDTYDRHYQLWSAMQITGVGLGLVTTILGVRATNSLYKYRERI